MTDDGSRMTTPPRTPEVGSPKSENCGGGRVRNRIRLRSRGASAGFSSRQGDRRQRTLNRTIENAGGRIRIRLRLGASCRATARFSRFQSAPTITQSTDSTHWWACEESNPPSLPGSFGGILFASRRPATENAESYDRKCRRQDSNLQAPKGGCFTGS